MRARIVKFGKSAAIRLPASIVRSARLTIGQSVEVTAQEGLITVMPTTRIRPTLEQLIASTPCFASPAGWLEDQRGLESDLSEIWSNG